MATVFELAEMSEMVYRLAGAPKGWKRDSYFDTNAGFYGAVFLKSGEAVVAFRGTQKFDINDIYNDLQLAQGQVPPQYFDAKHFAYRIQCWANEKKEKFFITGHSLGGGLASLTGKILNARTITFNAPSMVKVLKNTPLLAVPVDGIHPYQVNIRVEGDFVSNLLGQNDSLHRIIMLQTPQVCIPNAREVFFAPIKRGVCSHSMQLIVEQLRENKEMNKEIP